jgi:hypothetical protein
MLTLGSPASTRCKVALDVKARSAITAMVNRRRRRAS